MLKFVTILGLVAAASCGTVEDFIAGGKVVLTAIGKVPADNDVDCSHWFTITDNKETTNCPGKPNVPLATFSLANGDSFKSALIGFDSEEDLKNYKEAEEDCDNTLIKMLVLKTVNGFTEVDTINHEHGIVDRSEMLFSTKVPKKSELESITNGHEHKWHLKCYEN